MQLRLCVCVAGLALACRSAPATPAATPPATFRQDVPCSTASLTFVRIPAAHPFWISTTEVTWEMFDVYVYKQDLQSAVPPEVDALTRPSQPYNPMDRGFGHAGHPALSMSFQGAQGFCAWLAAHAHKKFRLPTEAEWELAARAGERSAWIGGSASALADYAWTAGTSPDKTRPVAQKRANEYGLFDVIGNAGEWCVALDGHGVMRGGAFLTPDAEARFDARAPDTPEWNRHDPQIPKSKWWLIDGGFVGLRVVCEDPP